MASFERLELLGLQPTCNGGAPVAAYSTIADAVEIVVEETLRGPDTVSWKLPLSSRSIAALQGGRIVRLATSDPADFMEFRIGDHTRRTTDGEMIDVTARSLFYDLADLGRVRDIGLGGRPNYIYALTEVTGAQLWSIVIAPFLAALGRSWVQFSAPDFPTQTVSLSWDGLTIPAILDLYTKDAKIQGELQWVRGPSAYTVTVVKKVGSAAPVVDVRDRKNLLAAVYLRSRVEQNTVVEPVLAGGAGLGDHLWRVSAIDTVNHRLTLEDPDGGPGPFIEDDQANGWWIWRPSWRGQSSEWFQVSDSAASPAHTVTVPGRSNQFVVGQLIQFRATKGTSERLDPQRFESLRPLRLTSVTPGTRSVTVQYPWAGAVTPILADDELLGWTARILRFVSSSAITTFDAAQRRITVASTAGWSVGQYALVLDAAIDPTAAQPWTLFASASRILKIEQLPGGNVVQLMNPFSSAVPFVADGAGGTSRLWVLSEIALPIIEDGTSGTSTYVLSSVTGLAIGDFLLPAQVFQGSVLVELGSPSAIGAYERVSKTLPLSDQHADWVASRNPAMRLWSGAASTPPDGYTVSNAKLNGLQESSVKLLGPYSVALRHKSSGTISGGGGIGSSSVTFLTPDNWRIGDVVDFTPSLETRTLTSVSADGRTVGFSPAFTAVHTTGTEVGLGGTPTLELPRLWAPSVIGADRWFLVVRLQLLNAGAGAIATVRFRAEDWDSQNQEVTDVSATGVVNGAWRTIGVLLQTAPAAQLRGWIELNAKANWPDATCYVDVAAFMPSQGSTIPTITEYAGATRGWQRAASQLLKSKEEPTTLDVDAIDLEVLNPTAYAGAKFVVGGNVRVVSDILPAPVTTRLVRRRLPVRNPAGARITVDSSRPDLADLLVGLP